MPGPQNADLIESVNAYGTPPTTTQQEAAASSSGDQGGAAYVIVSSSTDVRLIAPTETETVIRILARAVSSGVVFPTYIEPMFYSPSNTPSILRYWADQMNQIAALPGVVTLWTAQEVNAANQLVDVMTIVAQSTSGRSTEELTGAYYLLANVSIARQHVDASVSAMDAIEAG